MSNTPNPIDVHVGARVRMMRRSLRKSQEYVGRKLSVTYQQIQKYETGTNRISASKLWMLSKILKVPVTYFFDLMPDELANGGGHE